MLIYEIFNQKCDESGLSSFKKSLIFNILEMFLKHFLTFKMFSPPVVNVK